ncbi:MAG: hypothetical protein J4F50_03935, partial [Acidimicrobiia bacterium]|nr:hypothetical protein [Acidimicrobiia bacterium]
MRLRRTASGLVVVVLLAATACSGEKPSRSGDPSEAPAPVEPLDDAATGERDAGGPEPAAEAVTPSGDGPFVAVAAGREHTCGLGKDGEIECWGANDAGRSDPPDGRFTALSAGRDHTCGLRPDAT